MTRRDPSAETPSWQNHEAHVASLYKSLGFTVTPNVSVDGQQVDLLCEKWIPGIGPTCLYIDCKHTRLDENRSVSKDDVDKFIYSFRSRADANGWTAGVMVSNRPFSQQARAAAAKHGNIHLKTVDDLHHEILQMRPYLHESVRRYEESNQFSDFIPPYGSGSDSAQPSTENPILLNTFIQNWLQDESAPQACLFGDFGTGKTTFLEFLHYSLARKYLSSGSVRIPLLIRLHKFYEAGSHQELIRHFFAQECGVQIQYALFEDFLREGRLLLLLDGFDEMGARSDPTTRKANYLKLAPLVDGRSKVLISCRPAYFLSMDETHSVFSLVNKQLGFAPPVRYGPVSEHLYREIQDVDLKSVFSKTRKALTRTIYVHLRLFDKRQIRAYLKKHNGEITAASKGELAAGSLFTRIGEVYDLEDLAQRPILLKLIVKTLPLFRRTKDNAYEIEIEGRMKQLPDITPAVLYQVYTERELGREYEKGDIRNLIDRRDKGRIIAAIAFEMLRREELAIDRTSLSAIIRESLPNSEDDHDYYLTDIRNCSFLSRDVQDAVRFTHKSFMEYYAAVYVRMRMTGEYAAQDLLSKQPLSDEVALFLGDIIAADPNSGTLAGWLMDLYKHLLGVPSPSEVCVQNILNVLNYARRPIATLERVRAEILVYHKLDIDTLSAKDLSLAVLQTIKANVARWNMTGTAIRRWEARSSTVGELTGESVDLRGLRFWNVSVGKLTLSQSTIYVETWRDSRIDFGSLRGTTVINASGSVGPEWVPAQGVFQDCLLVGLDLTALGGVHFENCIMILCRAPLKSTKELSIFSCRGTLQSEDTANLGDWGCGLLCCDHKTGQSIQKKPITKSTTWNELLISSFGTEVARLPKSANEIKARLRRVDLAALLLQHLGRVILLSGGGFERDEYRIEQCDTERVTLVGLKKKARLAHPLERIVVEKGHGLHLRLEPVEVKGSNDSSRGIAQVIGHSV